ncbi:MAG TPA: DUF5958 family protein [Flavisolibacter sp.]|nr:DUF5958 family protein [Flavisolibacter sp.]
MLTNEEIILNKVAQEKMSFSEAIAWFHQKPADEQQQVLELLSMIVQQTHPTVASVTKGVEYAPVKPTVTPAVVLQTSSLKVALQKILALPATENKNAFSVLLSVFKVADTLRREEQCAGGCTHEWHNLPY